METTIVYWEKWLGHRGFGGTRGLGLGFQGVRARGFRVKEVRGSRYRLEGLRVVF